jgi:hypothetical protein
MSLRTSIISARLELLGSWFGPQSRESQFKSPGKRHARAGKVLLQRFTVADLELVVETNSELDGINYLKQQAVQGLGAAHSRRAYETAIEEFISWSLHGGKIRIDASQLRACQSHLTAHTPNHNNVD